MAFKLLPELCKNAVFPVICADKCAGIVQEIFILPRGVFVLHNVLSEVPVGVADFPPLAKTVSNGLNRFVESQGENIGNEPPSNLVARCTDTYHASTIKRD